MLFTMSLQTLIKVHKEHCALSVSGKFWNLVMVVVGVGCICTGVKTHAQGCSDAYIIFRWTLAVLHKVCRWVWREFNIIRAQIHHHFVKENRITSKLSQMLKEQNKTRVKMTTRYTTLWDISDMMQYPKTEGQPLHPSCLGEEEHTKRHSGEECSITIHRWTRDGKSSDHQRKGGAHPSSGAYTIQDIKVLVI